MESYKTEGRFCIRPAELAQRMGISRSDAYALANSHGFYPAFRHGKSILISITALERWLEEQTCARTTEKAI